MERRREIERQRKLRKRRLLRRLIGLGGKLLLIGLLVAGIWGFSKWDKIQKVEVDEENLEVYQDIGDYTNVALFGVDAREGEIESGTNSDCIMIASINNQTKEVKVVSVYRDCLMQQADGTYEKANSAYTTGGAEAAIALLNRNLDLDINKYITVNFNVMVDVIDAVGGVEIDVKEEEISELECHATEIIEITGKDSPGIEEAGLQLLNGTQATAYARIRHVGNYDFERTERQRRVLQQLIQKVQESNFTTLNKIIDTVAPNVATNFSVTELLGIAAHAKEYTLLDTDGFPFTLEASDDVYGHSGSYVVPVGMEANVKKLHEYLFGEEDYQPSSKVKTISQDISYLTDIYPEEE